MKSPRWVATIQLPGLPGAPDAHGHSPADGLQEAKIQAVKEAELLAQSGFEAILLENSGDAPYYSKKVPAETVASFAVIASAVRDAVDLPLGIRVLENDAQAALAIAAVTGCDFISIPNFPCCEPELLFRERAKLHAHIAFFAQINSGHAYAPISGADLGHLSLVDGVFLKIHPRGKYIDVSDLQVIQELKLEIEAPIYLHTRFSEEQLSELKGKADGILVESLLRKGERIGASLDPKRTKFWGKLFNQKENKR